MTAMTEEQCPNLSRYEIAGSPRQCFLPACHKEFVNTCFHGNDGHYYCSKDCADLGGKIDMTHVEELRPKITVPTLPKQTFFKR